MNIRTPRTLRRARGPKIKAICDGTFTGTQPLIEALVENSTHAPAWRPVRAAAALGLAAQDPPAGHVWMTPAEFAAFIERHFPVRSNRAGRLQSELGIARSRRHAILEDGAPVGKAEALACAHYALGLPLPIPPGDTTAFAGWIEPRFGLVSALTAALDVAPRYITSRLKGYEVTSRGRRERLPDAGLIRALDWVWRVGPISPYGRRLPAAAFPGQDTELA